MNSNIRNWYDKKNKLSKNEQLIELQKYLVQTDQNIAEDVYFSYDYYFNYFLIDKIDYKSIFVRPESIFKVNFLRLCKNLSKYFTNAKIEITFESPGKNDKRIKKINTRYLHDVYIKISDSNDNYYEIGIEYFEKKHDRIKDIDKEISSKINLDGYYIYNENDKNYKKFMDKVIYDIIICICALTNDKYTLAKISYFNKYKNKNTEILKRDTEIFNKIINWIKNDSVNFKKFFLDINPINQETEKEYTINEYIKLLNDEYDIKINNKTYKCNYDCFINILNVLTIDHSSMVLIYRNIYSKTMKIIIDSQDTIINFVKKINEKKKLIPKYIDYFLLNHIQHYSDKHTLNNVFRALSKKFI